jgi:hypothetical protein
MPWALFPLILVVFASFQYGPRLFFMVYVPVVLLSIPCWWWERRAWNRGRCRKHRRRWSYFDTDSQGGHGFQCHHYIEKGCVTWISWPLILPKAEAR